MDGLVQHEVGSVAAPPSEVPLIALAEHHAPLEREILDAWSRILRAGAFVNGPEVAAFEEEFAAACEVRTACGFDGNRRARPCAPRARRSPGRTRDRAGEHVRRDSRGGVLRRRSPFWSTATRSRAPSRSRELSVNCVSVAPPGSSQCTSMATQRTWMCLGRRRRTRGVDRRGRSPGALARYRRSRVGGLGRIGCFSFYPSKTSARRARAARSQFERRGAGDCRACAAPPRPAGAAPS